LEITNLNLDLISEDVLTIGMRGLEAENLLEHRHPNMLKFDEEGRLYIGDSLGSIHVWDVHVKYNKVSVSKLKELSHTELNGDAINTLNLLPYEKKRLLVHSRDNCIRSIDYGNPSGLRVSNWGFCLVIIFKKDIGKILWIEICQDCN